MTKQNSLAIEMQGITKRFPGVIANDDIDFELGKGEIHALLGENGAGKTTLMKCLYGLYEADKGEIFVNGKKVNITSPNVAISSGIGMVHQHFMLVPPFTVAENIILGMEPRKNAMIDRKRASQEVEEISNKYKLDVDPDEKVQDISVGMQQRVEILKALYRGADILIFDEPTAVLTPQEVDELISIMRSLTEEGKSIIFITHKLNEVKMIADRVTVIRDGQYIDTVETDSATTNDLAKMMVGRDVNLEVNKEKSEPGELVYEIENLHVRNNRGLKAVDGVSLQLREGEVLGLAGVAGNGQAELTDALFGLREIEEGKIKFRGDDITDYGTKKIIEAGISQIPEDRQKRGLILEFSLYENLILGSHYKHPYANGYRMNYKTIKEKSRELIKEYDVRTPDEKVLAKSLSGGNQQKVILARELSREPEMLIASQPIRGVDVGAIEFIHNRLIEQRNENKAIFLVSMELDEILSLSDRIAVIYEGEIMDVMARAEATEEKLGLLMAGADPKLSQREGEDRIDTN